MNAMGNICITGATGFIGSNLLKALRADKALSVTTIVRSKESYQKIRDLKLNCYLDDGNTDSLVKFFCSGKFEVVIHLASQYIKDHRSKEIDSLVASNLLFGTRLLEATVIGRVKYFINTGTFWQHYNNEIYSPVNLYAATKQAFEVIAQYYRETSDLNFVTINLNDTYGPGDSRKKILNLWMLMNESNSIEMSPGNQKMNLLHVDDVVSGFIRLIQLMKSGEFQKNPSNEYSLKAKEDITLRELASLYERISGKKLNINWGGASYRAREVMTIWDKGLPVPGWEPKISLDEGLRQLLLANSNGNDFI
jgi:nucleoside-diphosphate-sugar epimerase